MYMDDIKLFAKKGKRIVNLNRGNEEIIWWYSDEIWLGKIIHANNEKRKTRNDRRKRNIKSRKKSENSEQRKITNTTDYWNQTQSNERWKKKKVKKNYLKPNYITEIIGINT